jgi:hypothetical protein
MKRIPLTQDKFALVDDEDFEHLNRHKWRYNHGYAVRQVRLSNPSKECPSGKRLYISMHGEILGILNCHGWTGDHTNGDTLNNQKANLRTCRLRENLWNQKVTVGRKFKGVYWLHGRWQAHITVMGKLIYLGRFKEDTAAALAYNRAAKKHFGEFARLNNI